MKQKSEEEKLAESRKRKAYGKKYRGVKEKKKCHEVWSEIVRIRDGRCVICGKETSLAAHHFVTSAARSLRNRYDTANGITLCFGHHNHGVHVEASYAFTKKLVDIALAQGSLTQEKLDALLSEPEDSAEEKKGREFFEGVLKQLQAERDELKQKKEAEKQTAQQTTLNQE